MASFDISSEIDWQELDNAVNQVEKQVAQRFDFKGVKTEVKLDKKLKTVTLWCSESSKLTHLNDIFQGRLVKRGISLLALEYGKEEPAFGGSARQVIQVQAGISKEKGKSIISSIKEGRFKVQSQIQDDKVRVTAKSRDLLQDVIGHLKLEQDKLKVPMQFGNYRD